MSHFVEELQPMNGRSATPALGTQPRRSHEDEEKHSAAVRLKQSWYMVGLTLVYSALALYAWIATCFLTYRPITLKSYHYLAHGEESLYPRQRIAAYEANERWLQSARVIQAIVAVLTIPLTSAVCSRAAVVYVQGRARKGGLSLRQTMALADRGWTDVAIYRRLLLGQIRRYGTRFLLVAILLNILGGLIAPLQSIFLSIKTLKASTGDADWGGDVQGLNELVDVLSLGKQLGRDENLIPVLTRSAITSASHLDPQARLWAGGSTNCSGDGERPRYCYSGGISLANISAAPDPFLAQLPVGYNTGVVRQFLPRINSSGTRETISEGDFPSGCDQMPHAFYAHYDGGARYTTTNDYLNWSLTACMPGDQTQSPWKSTRSRQDFGERLYLNISTYGDNVPITRDGNRLVPYYLKITLNTTAGYFELPNYMNGQKPGPLIEDDLTLHCGIDCKRQRSDTIFAVKRGQPETTSNNVTTVAHGTAQLTNSSVTLETTLNRGPLLNIAIALFGNGSFLADRVANPQAFVTPEFDIPFGETTDGLNTQICTSQAPIVGLFEPIELLRYSGQFLPCISNTVHTEASLQGQLASFVSLLWQTRAESFNNVLAAAAFLTNEVWLTSGSQGTGSRFQVAYDQGVDTQVPVISLAGIVVVSALLGLYLIALLAMAVYGSRKATWTEQLDTFAMMRIGAAIADRITLKIVEDRDRLLVLDELPGWIGEENDTEGEEEDEIGKIGLGAAMPLSKERRYECMEDAR